MGNKEFWVNWLFPIIALVMFGTLLFALLYPMNSISLGMLVGLSSGLFAYTIMLVTTFMGSRPRFIEKSFGMPDIYEIHAVMGIVMTILVIVHVAFFFNGFDPIREMTLVSQTGWLGVICLILVMFTGIFSISGLFIRWNWMEKFKAWLNREVMLWLHRAAIIAIIAIYFHVYFIESYRNNTVFFSLFTIYTVVILAYYFIWKIQILTLKKYRLTKIYRGTPSLWVIEFEPIDGEIDNYMAGDYFFIRFIRHPKITGEGHPFSTSSAITRRFNNTIEFMIKDAGDWTESLQYAKEGDIVTLEGPYGNFLLPHVEESPEDEVPYILLAGGIGLTPCLSVMRHEHEKNSQREIHLFWGLSLEEDLFMLDELEEMQRANPNLHVHIIFSWEKVEGYDYGFITHDYLVSKGADHYKEGEFFACGPDAMLDAVRNLLDNANVAYEQKHIDDFGF